MRTRRKDYQIPEALTRVRAFAVSELFQLRQIGFWLFFCLSITFWHNDFYMQGWGGSCSVKQSRITREEAESHFGTYAARSITTTNPGKAAEWFSFARGELFKQAISKSA
jgi:hypothetical protein